MNLTVKSLFFFVPKHKQRKGGSHARQRSSPDASVVQHPPPLPSRNLPPQPAAPTQDECGGASGQGVGGATGGNGGLRKFSASDCSEMAESRIRRVVDGITANRV